MKSADARIDGSISIDVEEWFCAHNLYPPLSRGEWNTYELRAEASVLRLLELLDAKHARATFFMLGWVMEQAPDLAAEIHRRGHELATHGYDHRSLLEMTPEEFAADLERTLAVHSRQNLPDVHGYRAPSFTLTASTLWAVPILEQFGLRYSSSVFPLRGHPVYGMPDAPLSAWRIGPTLMEVPLTVARVGSLRIPCAGGAYFRLLPYGVTTALLRNVRKEGRHLNIYLHPWEIDPQQPRQPISYTRALRHYHNLHKTEERLQLLLTEFHLTSIKELQCLH